MRWVDGYQQVNELAEQLTDTLLTYIADREGDGFPGPQTLWIGLQRAADFVLALEAQRSIDAGGDG